MSIVNMNIVRYVYTYVYAILDFFITDWLRNRNTLEFIGIREKVYNPYFNYGEFATIRNQSGLNSFKISVKEFVPRTNAISLQAKVGRYSHFG